MTSDPTARMPDGSAIGRPVARVEGRRKVTGRADYAADRRLEGLAHAVMVNSRVGRGRITGIDTDAARAHPGVVAVISHVDGPRLPYLPNPGGTNPQEGERLHVLQDDQVHFFGQPVAVVVADTLEAAQQGARLVEVAYDDQLPSLDVATGPTATAQTYSRGDAESALSSAPVTLDLVFHAGRNHHNPMELHATVAQWEGQELTVWDKTQYVPGTQQELAAVFGLEASSVRVLSPYVGGGFGSGLRCWPHVTVAALAAREVQRPVKLVLDRHQMYYGTGYRPAYEYRLRLGSSTDGRLRAMTHELRSETSRLEVFTEGVQALGRMLYATPAVSQSYAPVPLDVNTPTYMRGPGYATAAHALETAMDELAVELDLDPIALRLRNEPDRDPSTGAPFSTRRLRGCLETGARRFGWADRDPSPGARREGSWLIGTGVASGCYDTARSEASARVLIAPDGTAVVEAATSDMGPGTYTSMTQVAADGLGLPMRDVTFRLGDSRMPITPPHGGSQTMASVGSAVARASAKARARVVRLAVRDPRSPLHGVLAADVEVAGGRLSVRGEPARGETYRQLMRRHRYADLQVIGHYTPDDPGLSMYAYGAIFAEVAVDPDLGLVRVRRLLGVFDAGRIINPRLAHSQALGGMIGGLGSALLEHTVTDVRDGRITNANLADYLVPVNADVPDIEAVYLNGEDPRANPLGVKGLGEIVQVGVAPAIGNAVFHASGRRVRDLPITVEQVLATAPV